jgi:hypothetical protein
MTTSAPEVAPTAGSIVKATLVALVVAAVVLVFAVLPAEYGMDLTGVGRLLGLNALATEATTAIVAQEQAYKTDATEFVIGSYETVEYKYRLASGASLQYTWEATRPVIYDFHAEPDGAAAGYAESFDQQTRGQSHGTYVAPFPGIHGWYWENPGVGDITIRLTTAGFYSEAIEFRGNGQTEKTFK